ncbi:hypothetical protein BHE74_00039169 [Ensete ventricosum]|nr:hypothetical protein BHE74_00039169 [Ensete ventricosum]
MTSALRPSTTTSAGGDHGAGDGKSKDDPVAAKAIGFLVVFGIAASIAVALLAKPNSHPERSQGPPAWDSPMSPSMRSGKQMGSPEKEQDLRRKEADHPLTDLNLSASMLLYAAEASLGEIADGGRMHGYCLQQSCGDRLALLVGGYSNASNVQQLQQCRCLRWHLLAAIGVNRTSKELG